MPIECQALSIVCYLTQPSQYFVLQGFCPDLCQSVPQECPSAPQEYGGYSNSNYSQLDIFIQVSGISQVCLE